MSLVFVDEGEDAALPLGGEAEGGDPGTNTQLCVRAEGQAGQNQQQS